MRVYYTSKIKYHINNISGRVFKYLTDEFILVSKGELISGKKKKILFEEKSTVIHNGIEKPIVNKIKNEKLTNIVTISRFDFSKNMQLAYEIAYAFRKNSNIKFTWIGDGDDMKGLKEKANIQKVNIDFIGFTTNPLEYLAKGSIYLSTSRFEGLPYALIEAASLGIPIIATDVVGNNECVNNHVNGFLFDTAENAVKYIKICINNPSLIKKMSNASLQYYEENFTITKMINKLLLIYSKY